MTGYLFDTTFLIDLVHGDKGAAEKAAEVDKLGLRRALSVVTVHEYLRGIYYLYGEEPKLLREKLKAAEAELSAFEILPYTYEVAALAARLDAELAKKGEVMGSLDVIVAATALHYGLTLVTRNVKHFSKVPNLLVESY